MMKRVLITACALTLSACGFTPMHAPNMGEGQAAFKNIRVELIDSGDISQQESGFFLQQSLMDRIGTGGNAHVLKVSSKVNRRGFGVTSNDVASRYDMNITAQYELIENVSGKTLDKGTVKAVTTFGSARDPYARNAAEKTASEQVARAAADQIIVKLASYYNKANP